MKSSFLIILLLFTACASRTKALDKLIGTNIEELLTKWDQPNRIIELRGREKAYAFVAVNSQSKNIEQAAGNSGVLRGSDIFFMYTVLITNEAGTILSWDVKRLDGYLDSSSLVETFNLHPL